MGTDADWIIRNRACDPAALAQHRSVFAISNGHFGLSGHVIGDHDGPWPLALVAGVYDELDMFAQIRAAARPRPWLDERHFDTAGRNPAIAALPDPLLARVFIGELEISFSCGQITLYEQTLLLRSGVYAYVYDFRDRAGRTTRVESQRFASLSHPGRAHMRIVVTARDHDEPIRIVSGIDGAIRSNITRERQFEIVDRAADAGGGCSMTIRTPARGHVMRLTVQHRVPFEPSPTRIRGVAAADAAYAEYDFEAHGGKAVILDRCVTIEDGRTPDATPAASWLDRPPEPAPDYTDALHANQRIWRTYWDRADIEIDGDVEAQRGLRFCLFHLLAAAPRWSEAASVPVKLLTGQSYQGNTFYDTDLYIVPFYSLLFPAWARTCIQFRFAGMDRARAIAAGQGFRGVKFAWQAGPDGEECLGDWHWFPRTNIHINADVAYSLMLYARATGDAQLLQEQGLDLLVGAARFYASRAIRDAAEGAWDFDDVAGPDEGHCHARGSFYTNFLAARTLEWAADAVERLAVEPRHAAARRLDLRPDEPALWRRIAAGLRVLFDSATNIYEQCAGFFALPPLPEDFLARRSTWFEPVYPYQAMNQPDVLMVMMLFGECFGPAVLRANWDFYHKRSLNFSSMSYAVHAIIAARLQEADEAYREFRISAGMDLDESLTGRRDTHLGLHGTAMGGAWLAAVYGLGGIQFPVAGPGQPVSLRIDPCLPPHWQGLRFKLMLHGELLTIALSQHAVEVHVGQQSALSLPARICGQELTLRSGQSYRVPRAAPS